MWFYRVIAMLSICQYFVGGFLWKLLIFSTLKANWQKHWV